MGLRFPLKRCRKQRRIPEGATSQIRLSDHHRSSLECERNVASRGSHSHFSSTLRNDQKYNQGADKISRRAASAHRSRDAFEIEKHRQLPAYLSLRVASTHLPVTVMGDRADIENGVSDSGHASSHRGKRQIQSACLSQDLQATFGKRHDVGALRLHALGGDRPESHSLIELTLTREPRLTAARCRQDKPLERQLGRGLTVADAQIGEERTLADSAGPCQRVQSHLSFAPADGKAIEQLLLSRPDAAFVT